MRGTHENGMGVVKIRSRPVSASTSWFRALSRLAVHHDEPTLHHTSDTEDTHWQWAEGLHSGLGAPRCTSSTMIMSMAPCLVARSYRTDQVQRDLEWQIVRDSPAPELRADTRRLLALGTTSAPERKRIQRVSESLTLTSLPLFVR